MYATEVPLPLLGYQGRLNDVRSVCWQSLMVNDSDRKTDPILLGHLGGQTWAG